MKTDIAVDAKTIFITLKFKVIYNESICALITCTSLTKVFHFMTQRLDSDEIRESD